MTGEQGPRRSTAPGRQSAGRALVISLLKAETAAAEAAFRHVLKGPKAEKWRVRFCSPPRTGVECL